ncbi:tumor suppressor protein [Popillia japonica]|uniref:BLOC-1-related complex subunit 5 n=1 Tax=Popillia japonica TaxID=7064 RepID=A0AAW1JRJ3_POPJA
MGSEHSAHLKQSTMSHQSEKQANLYRQHTIANPGGDLEERPGSTSPGPSICSDSDLPYISYTVNRPIGDSPKLSNRQLVKSKVTHRKTVQKYIKKSVHNIVVVKPPISGPNVEKDPDILHLASIPMFLPIMRATLNLPAARDPEVLERLDPAPLTKLCLRYQTHLHTCSNLVATEQNLLIQKIRETDVEITKIVAIACDKQKRFAKYAERLMKVQELSHQLNRCHMFLNQTLESIESLNQCLDIEDRLEPFVWTTG